MKLFGFLAGCAVASDWPWVLKQFQTEAGNVFTWAAANYGKFSEIAGHIDSTTSFDALDGDGDKALSIAELEGAAKYMAGWAGTAGEGQGMVYNYAVKHWDVIDRDGNDSLCRKEYREFLLGAVAANARVLIAGFDEDGDEKLSGGELSKLHDYGQSVFDAWGWNANEPLFKAG